MNSKEIIESKLIDIVELDPRWVSGFVNGEGCFSVSFTKRPKRKIKVEPRPSFSVTQVKQNLLLLESLKKFFGCGSIRYSRKDGMHIYEVRSIKDLTNKVLPHFDKYSLMFEKDKIYQLFKEVCLLCYQNKHKNSTDLKRIIDLSYNMNLYNNRKTSYEDLLKLIAS